MKKLEMSRFAVMNMIYKFHSFKYFLDNMQEFGITKVNLWGGHPQCDFLTVTDREISEMRSMMEERGIHAICFTPEQINYPINIADSNAAIRDSSIKALLRCVEITTQFDAGILQLCPGYALYDADDKTAAWNRSRDAIAKVCEAAGKVGVTVILEPLQIVESNLVGDVTTARKMFDDVGSPFLKMMVDTTHMAVKGEKLEAYFKEFGKDLYHIHFNESGQIPHGQGNLPLADYLDVIEAYDYENLLTLEMCPRRFSIDPKEASRSSITYMRNLLESRA